MWDKGAQRWYAPSGSDLTAFEPWLPNHLETRPAERDHGRDPRQEFAEALREAGLELNGLPEMDGRLYRVRAAGDGRGERSGWYVGHADGHPAGSFGDWRTGDSRLWKSQRPVTALGAADRARLRAETAQRRLEREQQAEMQHEAAVDAIAAHLGMAAPAPADHPYLAGKGVGAHGVFLDLTGTLVLPPDDPDGQKWSARGNLLVPVRDADGALIGAQSIGPDGFKAFARGGRLSWRPPSDRRSGAQRNRAHRRGLRHRRDACMRPRACPSSSPSPPETSKP